MIHRIVNFRFIVLAFSLWPFLAMGTIAESHPVNSPFLISNRTIVTQKHSRKSSQKTILRKSFEIAKFASAAIIALGANLVLDYATTFVHECGHAWASKLLWGGPIHFEVFQREYGGMGRILRLHGGGTHFPSGAKSRGAILIAMFMGPLLGQLFLEFQSHKISEILKKQDASFENNDRISKGFGQSCKAIYVTFKEIIWNNSSTPITKKRYKALILHFLNTFIALRAVEQFFYGFTPLSRDLRALGPQYAHGASDGKIIWHQLFGIPMDFLQDIDIDSLKLALGALGALAFST